MKPSAALADTLYAEMLARIKEDDQTVPYRRGRPLLLLAHGAGQAVPHPLPQAGKRGRARRGDARSQCARGGPSVLRPRHGGGERRRPPPRLYDRPHRVPAVHAVRQGPAHGRAPARSHREGRVDRVGRRRPDAVLRHGGRGQAAVSALPPRARRGRRRSRLRGDGRAVQPGRRAHAEPPLSARHLRELHDDRGALSRRRGDGGAVDAHPAPGAGSRVPRRPLDGRGRGGALLHPHQWRAAGGTFASSPRPWRIRARSDWIERIAAPRRRDARGRRGLRRRTTWPTSGTMG